MSDPRGEYFAATDEEIVVPATLDADERTVDVVWYGGATVPRTVTLAMSTYCNWTWPGRGWTG
jgi:hypothetical protein